jgi:hypothetical protein
VEAKRYLKSWDDIEALNFANTQNGYSRLVFAKRVSGKLDGDGEAAFLWLYDASKQVIELADKARK